MDEIQYGFFDRIKHSILTGKFYLDIRKETTGKAIKYFLLIVLLLTSITFIKTAFSMNAGLQEANIFVQNELPDFTLQDGRLTVHDPMPIVNEFDGGIVVIDTTGQYLEDVLDSYEMGIFVTTDRLVYKKNSIESQTMKFTELNGFELQKSDILFFVGKWSGAVIAVFVIVGILFSIAGKFIGLLVVSVLGIIINAIMKTGLKYDAIIRTSVYAMTLAMIINTAIGLTGFQIPFFFILYYGLISFYFYRAFRLSPDDAVYELE